MPDDSATPENGPMPEDAATAEKDAAREEAAKEIETKLELVGAVALVTFMRDPQLRAAAREAEAASRGPEPAAADNPHSNQPKEAP